MPRIKSDITEDSAVQNSPELLEKLHELIANGDELSKNDRLEETIETLLNDNDSIVKELQKISPELNMEAANRKATISIVKDIFDSIVEQEFKSSEIKKGNRNDEKKLISIVLDKIENFNKGNDNSDKETTTNDNSFDYELNSDHISNDTLMSNINNNFEIISDGVKTTNNDTILQDAGKIADDSLAELKKLTKQQETLRTQIEKGDDSLETKNQLASINGNISLLENVIDALGKLDKTLMTNNSKKSVNKAQNSVSIKNQAAADKAAKDVKGTFDIVSQGAKGFGDTLSGAEDGMSQFADALSGVGGNLSALSSDMRNNVSGFTKMLSLSAGPLAMFTGAMMLAGNAIKGFHDKLDIGRSYGGGTEMVDQLRDMHVSTLMPPDQLKALSDNLSQSFGVSLTKNRSEMEKVAIKQRLSERVMGKEYAESQMEALGSLKEAMTSNSVGGKMDELMGSTSALAKTMGISNKVALEQIKAIHENSKVLTEGLNRDIAKKIEATMQQQVSGLVAAGMSPEEAQELMKGVAETLSSKDNIAKELTVMTSAMGDKDGATYKAIAAEAANQGVSVEEMMKVMAQAQTLGFDKLTGAQKKIAIAATKASSLGQSKQIGELQSIIDSGDKSDPKVQAAMEKLTVLQQANYKANSAAYNMQKNNPNYLKDMAKGSKEAKSRQKGEATNPDLDKILIAMGATDKESSDKMLDQLIANQTAAEKANTEKAIISNGDKKEFDELTKKIAAGNGTKEDKSRLATIKRDAFKSGNADLIKENVKNVESGKGPITLGGATTVSGGKITKLKSGKDLANARTNIASTKVEITKDKAEKALIKANILMEKSIMGVVNTALPALMSAFDWISKHLTLVGSILGGLFAAKLIMLAKGPLGLIGRGIMSATNMIGKASANLTAGIAKGLFKITTAPFKSIGMLSTGFKNLAKNLNPKNLFGGLKQGLSTISNSFKNFSLKGIKEKFSSFGDKLKSFSPSNIGKQIKENRAAGGGMFTSFEKDDNGKIKIDKDGKGIKKKGGIFSAIGGGLKSLAGPALLAGAAMKALQGAMKGWGKAGDWFGVTKETKEQMSFAPMIRKSKEELSKLSKDELKAYNEKYFASKKAEKLAKQIDPSAVWDATKKSYVDSSGKIIQTSADKLKIESDNNKKLAESFSKTGTAIWDGTKYVDEYGETIEASATLSQKSASAFGGALEALSFGMLDGNVIAHKTTEAFTWIGEKMDKLGLTETLSEFGSALAAIGKVVWEVTKKIFEFLSPLLDVAAQVFSGIFKYIKGFFQILTGIFTGDLGKIGEGIKTIMSGFVDMLLSPIILVTGFVDKLFGTDITSSITSIGKWLSNFFGGLVDFIFSPLETIKKLFSGFGDTITKPIDALTNYFSTIFDSAFGGIFKIWDNFKAMVTAPFDYIMGFINGKFTFKQAVTGIFTSVVDGVTNIFGGFLDLVTSPFKGILSFIDSIFGTNLLGGFTTTLGNMVDGVKTYFTSISDSVMKIVGGYWDIITSPFKRISSWLDGNLTFGEMIKGIFSDIVNGITTIFSGFIDLVLSPFKGIISFIDETFGTNFTGIFQNVIDGVTNIFGGFLDLVTAPFKAVMAYFTDPKMSLLDLFKNMFSGVVNGVSKIFGGLQQVLKKPINAAFDWIKSLNPFADSDTDKIVSELQGNASSEQKSLGADLYKQLGFKSTLGVQQEMDKDTLTKKAEGLSNKEIKALIASDSIDNTNIEQLAEILKNRGNDKDTTKVEVKTLTAKADGGSTGGLGDTFAKMIMPDLSKETPVATVGTNEFVFSSDMIKGFLNKFGIGKKDKKTTISPSIGVSSTDSSAKMDEIKSKDGQKLATKEQRKIADETVKKQTKDGIDNKQATTMVDTLKSMAKKLNDTTGGIAGKVADGAAAVGSAYFGGGMDIGKSVIDGITGVLKGDMNISDALGNIGGTAKEALGNLGSTVKNLLPNSIQDSISKVGGLVSKGLGATGKVGGSIKNNVSGVLSGDINPMDALKNVGQTIVGQLPGKITDSVKSVTEKLGTTGASITNNLQGVLTGETSIGTALSNVGGTMKEQLLGPLQQNLTGAFTKLTGEKGLGGIFNSFTGEGGALDSVMDSFAGGGQGTLGKSFAAIAGENGPLGSALGGIGESISGAMSSITSSLGSTFSGLLGGDSKDGGGGVVSGVLDAGKSLLGGFFAEGGATEKGKINIVGENGPEIDLGGNNIMSPDSLIEAVMKFGPEKLGFTPSSGLDVSAKKPDIASKSASGLSASVGTSGSIPSKAENVSMGASSQMVSNSTTTNTTETTAAASMANVEKLLTEMLVVNNKQLNHLGVSSKEATKQNQIAQKSFKKSVDSSEVKKQQYISDF